MAYLAQVVTPSNIMLVCQSGCFFCITELCIEAQQYKVYPGTEKDVYHNGFFLSQDLVVNALDNVEARRYVDGRCVTNLRPLLESGTMGAKGHVQVPYLWLTLNLSHLYFPFVGDSPSSDRIVLKSSKRLVSE